MKHVVINRYSFLDDDLLPNKSSEIGSSLSPSSRKTESSDKKGNCEKLMKQSNYF